MQGQIKEKVVAAEKLFRELMLVTDNQEMDCNGMMGHILQCIVALKLVAKPDNTDVSASNNIVFQAAVEQTLSGLFDKNVRCHDRVVFLFCEIFKLDSDNKLETPSWYPLD